MPKQYLHQRIQSELISRIVSGDFSPGAKIPTTKELARAYRTSSVTIDKALTGLVEMGMITRKAKYGSVVNARDSWTSENATGRPASIYGLVMRDSSSPYFWRNTIKGIHDAVRARGGEIVFGYVTEELATAREYIRQLHQRGVQGIIYAPVSMPTKADYERYNSAVIDLLHELQVPFVLIDRYVLPRDTSHIVSADYEAAVTLTRRLIERGARRPICLTHLYNTAFEERIRGFVDALREATVPNPETRIVDIAPRRVLFDANDTELIASALQQSPEYDAVLSVNAYNLYAYVNTVARYPELKPPQVRYANFDEIALLNIPELEISAEQQALKIGFMAGSLLIDQITAWRGAVFHVRKSYSFRTFGDDGAR